MEAATHHDDSLVSIRNIDETSQIIDSNKDLYIFKIVVVGDSSTGKTSIISRFVNNEFINETKSTVGVEFSDKLFKLRDVFIKIHLWDTAGQERYNSVTKGYYKGAKGALITFDLTRKETFNSVDRWIKEINANSDNVIPVILIGNKSDLKSLRQVEFTDAINKAKELSNN